MIEANGADPQERRWLEEYMGIGTRAISTIAAEIRRDWQRPNYAAKPYLDAMDSLTLITDYYFEDSAKSVVLYFLSNASSWRGETAKRVKAELRLLLKEAP